MNIYCLITSNITGDCENFSEDEVLSYIPEMNFKILPLCRSMSEWSKQQNSKLIFERRIVSKKVIKRLSLKEKINNVCIATFYFERKDGKNQWFGLYWNKI